MSSDAAKDGGAGTGTGQNGRPLPRSVLFVCNHNTVRSPMAEGLMRQRFRGKVFVESVGVSAGEVDPFANVVMEEAGLSIADVEPKSIDDLDDASFDLIIALTPAARDWALDFTETLAIDVEYWPTADPTEEHGTREQRLAAYRAVRDQLAARINERFGKAEAAG